MDNVTPFIREQIEEERRKTKRVHVKVWSIIIATYVLFAIGIGWVVL